jgi:amidase
MQWGETHNNVFGRTTNPYNRKLTPGGSSGGEGALLAMRGSPLGVGTDIDGYYPRSRLSMFCIQVCRRSLRIPSAFCGLYTLRPSYERLPYHGASNTLMGQESISSVLGPMSTSISSLKMFTKAIIDARPWDHDPLAVRKVWNEEEYRLVEHGGGKEMCFAIMWDNEVVKPHPPLIRAMRIVKQALEKEGHHGKPVSLLTTARHHPLSL